ncbi:hypothetical protein V2J09_001617 [Rumex salicifolius]
MNQRLKLFTLKGVFYYSEATLNLLRAFSSLPTSSSVSPSPASPSSSSYISRITNTILYSQSPGEAYSFFSSISSQINCNKTIRPHAAIIFTLTKARWYKDAKFLTKVLIQNLLSNCSHPRVCSLIFKELTLVGGSNLNTDVLGILIIGLSETGLAEEACWVYRKLRELPALRVSNALLGGLVKSRKYDDMWNTYNDLVSRGAVPSVVTYGILMDSCCNQCDVGKALQLFDEMVGRGIEPTIVIYTTLIRGLCNEGKLIEAEDIFRTMRRSGVLPGLYTYNTLLDGYCKMASLSCALQLYWEMLCNGLEPDVVTFGILINALCREGELDDARYLFVYMIKFGIRPNILKGNMKGATGIYMEMVIKGLPVDVVAYTDMIDGHFKNGNTKEAILMYKEMLEGGVRLNDITVSCLIDGLCKDGRFSDAIRIFLKYTNLKDSSSLLVNHIVYTTIIQGMCTDNRMFEASMFFADMRCYGVKPDAVSYLIIMRAYLQSGEVCNLIVLHADMIKNAILPNAAIYAVLSKCYNQIGDAKSLLGCFEDLVAPSHGFLLMNCEGDEDLCCKHQIPARIETRTGGVVGGKWTCSPVQEPAHMRFWLLQNAMQSNPPMVGPCNAHWFAHCMICCPQEARHMGKSSGLLATWPGSTADVKARIAIRTDSMEMDFSARLIFGDKFALEMKLDFCPPRLSKTEPCTIPELSCPSSL